MKSVNLDEVAEVLYGYAFDSERFGDEGDLPLVRIRDVVRGRSNTYYSGEYDPRYIVDDGDLLIGMDGEFNRERWSGGRALLNQRVCRIKALDPRLDESYLYWFLPEALKEIERQTPFVTVKHLSAKQIKAITLPLPPVEEQRRIASILDAADALRSKRRQALEKLDTLTQSIFIDMFGDPRSNDRGWPLVPFSELCPSHLGKMLDSKRQTGLHVRPYLRNANVRWFGFDLTDLATMDFDESDRLRYRLVPGDVLICEGGEPGRAAVWRGEIDECYFQKALHRGRPNPALSDATFLVHLLAQLARRGGLLDHISTATIAHLTGERLKQMTVIAPPLGAQQEFSSRVATIDATRAKLEASSRNLDALFSSIQNRAFRGEM